MNSIYAKNLADGIAEGSAALNENRLPHGYPSSANYDAALITMHCLYWTGQQPKAISTSRGYTFNVQLGSQTYKAKVTNPQDHREGVAGIR